MYCSDCSQPTGDCYICADCRAERKRLGALHRWWRRTTECRADAIGRAERIAQLRERAKLKAPLFAEAS